MIKTIFITLLFALLQETTATAQDKIQVAVKTINKELTMKQGDNLFIDATKSKITIKGWNKNTVQLTLRLIAKHPRKEIALREVEYNQYKIDQDKNGYTIRNYFYTTDNYSAVKSNLTAEYVLFIPQQQSVEVSNSYGTIVVQDVAGDVVLTGKFSPISITNFKGNLTIHTNYSDLQVNKISGHLDIKSIKSNNTIYQSEGSCSIKSEYGEAFLFPENVLDRIEVIAIKSGVNIFVNDLNQYNYSLSTTHSEIILPEPMLSIIKKEGNTVRYEKHEPGKPTVSVTTTFNSINIRNK